MKATARKPKPPGRRPGSDNHGSNSSHPAAGSSTTRHTTVEIDRVAGTEPPPRSLVHNEKQYTLESIFAAAGMGLTVVESDDNLPDAQGGTFDRALLHKTMMANRSEHRRGWYAHVLVVPAIEWMEGFEIVQPMGVMYDDASGADPDGRPREGCAVAASQLRTPLEYLRTLAHELGHVFNLEHVEPPKDSDNSIMNQTEELAVRPNYPNIIDLAFNERDTEWLEHARPNLVMPGGDERDTAGPDHTDEGNSHGLELTVSTARAEYEPGEPVYLRVSLRNASAKPIVVNSTLSASAGTLQIRIMPPHGDPYLFRPMFAACLRDSRAMLEPQAEMVSSEAIFLDSRGRMLTQPGDYQLVAGCVANADGRRLDVSSAPAKVVITEGSTSAPYSSDHPRGRDGVLTRQAAAFVFMRGGRHIRGAEAHLKRIIERRPKCLTAQHARLALIAEELKKRTPDLAYARKLLAQVDPENLEDPQRFECLRLQALFSRTKSAQDARLNAMLDLVQKGRPDADRVMEQSRRWLEGCRKQRRSWS